MMLPAWTTRLLAGIGYLPNFTLPLARESDAVAVRRCSPRSIDYAMVLLVVSFSSTLLSCGQTAVADDVEEPNQTTALVSVEKETPGPPESAPPLTSPADTQSQSQPESKAPEVEEPWDYSPYRVLVWIVSDHPRIDAKVVDATLRDFLDREFAAVWRVSVADAPDAVRTAAFRDLGGLSYDVLTAADPILAVKKGHPDAVRIRTAQNVGTFVKRIDATKSSIERLLRRAAQSGNPKIDGVAERLTAVDGDALLLRQLWSEADTEAVLMPRGMAMTLTDPEAKLVTAPINDLVSETIEAYDKIFIARVQTNPVTMQVDVVEMDTLMRHFGPVASVPYPVNGGLGETIGRGMIKAFAPVVRIDDAGQKNASGLLRAAGLILDPESRALIRTGDVLQPMTRKNDRNGDPFLIGAIDWSLLLVTEVEQQTVKMDYYAGRAGGLQGRKNSRTFRTALKIRPFESATTLRLHAQGRPDLPLIGYEIYEKELTSKDMTFLGRTDWNGRLLVDRNEDPLRLLYVKNGGAVLARLPLAPGLAPTAVADLRGDDLRLQAEAYIRGVQNAIIDLVAVRELYKARIHLRLQNGQMKEAETLMEALRNQPSNEKLATALGKEQTLFLKAPEARDQNQRRKVDEMFTSTRELLSKYINPRLVRELETDMITAKNNGGRLPAPPEPESADEEPSAGT